MIHTMLLNSEFVEFSSTLASVPRYVLFFPVYFPCRIDWSLIVIFLLWHALVWSQLTYLTETWRWGKCVHIYALRTKKINCLWSYIAFKECLSKVACNNSDILPDYNTMHDTIILLQGPHWRLCIAWNFSWRTNLS